MSLALHLALIGAVVARPLASDTEAPLAGEATALPILVSLLIGEDTHITEQPALIAPASPAPATQPVRRRSRRRHLPVAPPAPNVAASVVVDRTSSPADVVGSTSSRDEATPDIPAPAPDLSGDVLPAANHSAPERPLLVSPAVGRGLRLEDTYPELPASLRVSGYNQVVQLEVCVSVRGAVDEIRFASHTPGALRTALEEAIRGWRYQALVVEGGPIRFCHQMRIEYRLS